MVLGANDGIISTSALLLGVAAADAGRTAILTAGMAGLVAGAVSMGLGEYVSVSSQADSEGADLARERKELADRHGRASFAVLLFQDLAVIPFLALLPVFIVILAVLTGNIAEEQRFVSLFDRVDTTATTWLGMTMACAQCHDHKYDPIPQRDFFRMMAFFNHVDRKSVV